jgi:exosortase A-associated hydrolase 1
MCRMQVQMARAWAAQGVPVMRFDHRGLGDSEGEFRGFRDLEADLDAAIRAFQAQVPGMSEVVLWGGCDAASAALINAWKFPAVTGIVLGNPWVHSEDTADEVAVRHFGQRLRDKDFWLKVVRLRYNPLPALATIARRTLKRLLPRSADPRAGAMTRDDPSLPHLDRMRNGLSRFKGDLLLIMSGRSLVSQEFDQLVAANPPWQQALRSPRRLSRHNIPDGDQAFSTIQERTEVALVTARWVLDPGTDLAAVVTAAATAEAAAEVAAA